MTMSRLGQVRKAVVTAVGMAVTLVLIVPENILPERLRPYVAIVLALGTIFGVYRAPNDTPPLPTRAARADERQRRMPDDPDRP
jgi:disulfide bond formation protein DsbB